MIQKIASHCCVCGKELVDATSCEFGIGPVCRRKYDYEDAYPVSGEAALTVAVLMGKYDFPLPVQIKVGEACNADDSRRACNVLIYFASAEQGDRAVQVATILRVLGYAGLADRIEDRLVGIKFSRTPDGRVAVKTPYHPGFVTGLKAGLHWNARAWDGAAKVWVTEDSPEACAVVSRVLAECFSGACAVGPMGPFKIAAA